MDYQTIVYSTDGTVATISLNRLERLNTIVPPMPEEIANAESLVEPILGEDSDKAEQSLISFARFLGKMHATTAGKSQDF